MRIESAQLTVDTQAQAAYVTFSDAPATVCRTREISDVVLVDLDEYDVVTGIEILDLDAALSISDLLTQCHFAPGSEEALRILLPYVSTWRQQIDSTSSKSVVRAGDNTFC
ncbi:DUF2283 domain-containing protein [Rhodococcus cercidiphylli]|jgi:uncharacterized protein YuzE|uniref:DUF2283 domain-containing protein n=1 Tax=Rhodococcus cercidiphylli TaxID=489916 RepID=A0ABU4AXB5_9NOCA|nr:DUF2283 domain-containing protein [Rhodococcus cercidiphylli]MDV6230861.1 DUF2283 domain-containing protein [Rhodococcus cercidiphylli]